MEDKRRESNGFVNLYFIFFVENLNILDMKTFSFVVVLSSVPQVNLIRAGFPLSRLVPTQNCEAQPRHSLSTFRLYSFSRPTMLSPFINNAVSINFGAQHK